MMEVNCLMLTLVYLAHVAKADKTGFVPSWVIPKT